MSPKSKGRARPTGGNRRPTAGPRPGATRPAAKGSQNSGTSARARLAAEAERKARRRRLLTVVVLPVALVLVAVGVLVLVRFTGVGSAKSGPSAVAGDPAVISKVTSVPASVLDQVGVGTATTPPKAIEAPALLDGTKPRVLYVGAEYCPYCAAERWSMVVALSRFGTFTGLGQTASSASDVFPSTQTLSFHGSSFSSSTVSFTGVEIQSNEVVNGQYAPLDTLSPEDEKTFSTYNSPPYVDQAGSIPFVDIGGKYIISGASFSPEVLQGKSHQQIADALSDPDSDIAKGVNGAANLITAAICATTTGAPTAVCTSAGVQAAAQQLG
ncbi:MAG: DUF929 family protein [Propionibacteriaceae bacterium]